MLPAVSTRRRRMTIAAGLATVVLGSAVAVFGSQRSERGEFVAPPAGGAASTTASTPSPTVAAVPPPPAPAAPLALTRQDSLAIAEAVQKRLAKEEAVRGRDELIVIADSITAHVRKSTIDSILRASLPAGVKMPVWRDVAPPAAWGGKRRVVVTPPREGKSQVLNAFGGALSDSIRRALMKRKSYSVVDPDSVESALSVSRARSDVEKALKPDLLISSSIVGAGDSMTVLVTVRDVRTGAYGTRVASTRFETSDPEKSIPKLVLTVVEQVESLSHMPGFVRMRPNVEVKGAIR